MPGSHARFSPSAANRRIHCPPSLLLEEQFEEGESIYAAEGTAGHSLAEHLIRKHLKMRTKRPTSDYYTDELVEAAFALGGRRFCPLWHDQGRRYSKEEALMTIEERASEIDNANDYTLILPDETTEKRPKKTQPSVLQQDTPVSSSETHQCPPGGHQQK